MAYTYLVGWSKHNKYYYGARWAKGCTPDDLWTTYFTSSTHVKDFCKQHGNPDIIQVRKVFDTIDKCRMHEYKVLERLHVLTKDKWLNKNINGRFLPVGSQTKEHIDKRVQSGIETRKKNGTFGVASWTKETNPTAADKVSKALKGKTKTISHIVNMRTRPQDTTVLTCPHCKKIGDYKNMMRWHMDQCKQNPNNIVEKEPNLVTCTRCGHITKQSPNFYRYHNDHCKT